jgi:hypothetical protein
LSCLSAPVFAAISRSTSRSINTRSLLWPQKQVCCPSQAAWFHKVANAMTLFARPVLSRCHKARLCIVVLSRAGVYFQIFLSLRM